MNKIILLLILISGISLSSCNFLGKRVRGDGNVVTEDRRVGSFHSIEAGGKFDVVVSQGTAHTVKVEADQNLLELIEVFERNGTIQVKERRGYNLRPTKDIRIYVSAPVYKEIQVSGSGSIIGEGKITNAGPLALSVSGAGDMNMDVDAPSIRARISGSGSINLRGKAPELDASISGAGNANCFDMVTDRTEISISGAGNAEVNASTTLDAKVSGAGSVKYKGNPKVNSRISGAGSVDPA